MLVWPVQTVVVFFVSTLVYKERTGLGTLAGTILCVAGVIFMTGIVLVNLPAMKSRHNEQTDE